MRRSGKILLGIFLATITLILLTGVCLFLFRVPVSLNLLKGPLQDQVREQFGLRLEIRGDIYLVSGLRPSLEIADAALINPGASQGELLFASRAYLDLDLPALFERTLEVGEMSVTGLRLALRVDERGVPNWRPGSKAAGGGEAGAPGEPQAPAGDSLAEMLELGEVKFNFGRVRLDDIEFSYRDRLRNTEFIAAIDRGLASVRWDAPMTLELEGHSNNIPVEFELEASPVAALLDHYDNWRGTIALTLGKLEMGFDAALTAVAGKARRDPTLQMKVRGDSLQEVTELIDVPLPPWGPYRLEGRFGLSDTGYRLDNVALGVGQSNLSGNLGIDLPDGHPKIVARLQSRLIDTHDFEIGQWQGFEYDSANGAAASDNESPENKSLLDPELLEKTFVDIDIVFDEIRSGNGLLGNGQINLLAADGRIGIENFEASIPGGLVRAGVMLKPGAETIGADVFIDAKEFDYGIIARRHVPDSLNKGRLFLDVKVSGESDSLENLLAGANGEIDLALWPEQFEAGAFDLWAAGLLSAAMKRYGDPSLVNCVVARFALEDGVMTQRAILMDTSEIRVIGDGRIDFRSQTIDVYLVPKAKQAALISIAVPVGIKGGFEDFDLSIHSHDVVDSVFRNAANIVFLGLPLLFHKPLEKDGTAACEEAMLTDIDLTVRRPPGSETPGQGSGN